VDPRDPLPVLPEAWRDALRADPEAQAAAASPDDWDGPPPEELLRRALLQPGALRRSGGVKFACPACREICPDCGERHDKDLDNAIVHNDGRFGCCTKAPEHRRAIAVALGVVSEEVPERVASVVAGIFGLSGLRGL